MSTFGEKLKELRETKTRLNQRKFGEKYGVDNSTVSRWESGKATPDPETMKKIASDFGVSLDWLMGEKANNDDTKLDLKDIKKAIQEKELIYDDYEFTQEEQEDIRSILLAVIEREEKKAKK